MKCFIHIGTEKTATTTIQDFLNLNRGKLLRDGFIYTKSAGESNNRSLACAAFNESRRDDFTRSLQLNTDTALKRFQEDTLLGLKREINELYDSEKTVVFSSEHFQSRLTDINEVSRLRDIIVSLGATEIFIIVYLRRPADIACSLFSTALKCGNILEEPPHPHNSYWNNICNHKATLERFASAFGYDSVIPRLFNTDEFLNGSIIDDFTSILGLPNTIGYTQPANSNESLSRLGVSIIRKLNVTIPQWRNDKINTARGNILSYIERHFTDYKYIMPDRLYAEYEEEFRGSNEWVREHFFPDKTTLFSTNIPKASNVEAQEEHLERIANLIADIWNTKQNEILDLRSRMSK